MKESAAASKVPINKIFSSISFLLNSSEKRHFWKGFHFCFIHKRCHSMLSQNALKYFPLFANIWNRDKKIASPLQTWCHLKTLENVSVAMKDNSPFNREGNGAVDGSHLFMEHSCNIDNAPNLVEKNENCILCRDLRVLDTRLVLGIFCPTRTRFGPNTTRTE